MKRCLRQHFEVCLNGWDWGNTKARRTLGIGVHGGLFFLPVDYGNQVSDSAGAEETTAVVVTTVSFVTAEAQ